MENAEKELCISNVTLRKRRINLSSESLNLSFTSLTPNSQSRSLQDISTNSYDEIEILKDEIQKLNIELQNALKKIESLTSENMHLKQQSAHPISNKSPEKEKSSSDIHSQEYPPKNTQPVNTTASQTNNQNGLPDKKIISISIASGSKNLTVNNSIENTKIEDKISINSKPKIIIFGDQSARGLSKSLIESRSKLENNDYKIAAFIKPYATSERILSSCNSEFLKSLSSEDIVILAIGANDKNPFNLFSNLCNTLHQLRNQTVFVTKFFNLNTVPLK
ncbi:unnamed protein product [Colias eurytheme]|nr:unnamed protein product [Colias eurytheme]